MAESASRREPIEELAESFLARFRAGERPALSEFTAAHPELADQIRELFPTLLEMEQAGSAIGPETGLLQPCESDSAALANLGEYRIIREVGRGGMGVVYEATQESLGRHVALKVFAPWARADPRQIERFRREARAAARLHHTNIVPVFGVGEHDGQRFYAMQFIQGQGLDAILHELRRMRLAAVPEAANPAEGAPTASAPLAVTVAQSLLTGQFAAARRDEQPVVTIADGSEAGFALRNVSRAAAPVGAEPSSDASHWATQPGGSYARTIARVGLQVAEARAHAHGQGVFHRDIKPSNLLLDIEGNVWVTDFGLAKGDDAEALTEVGDIVGTVRYMAPERFEGYSGPESDVYGLGVTLYELLSLRPAFDEGDRARLIDRILHSDPPWLRSIDAKIPRDLETIVHKAMSKHPADRYASASALAEDLRRFLEDRTILARRSSSTERFWRWCRRNPVVASLLALAMTLTAAIAIISTVAAWIYLDQLNEITWSFKQLQQAQTQRQLRLFESLVSQAQARRVSRRMGQRFEALEALSHAATIARELKLSPERLELLRDEAIACLALPDLKPIGRVIQRPPGNAVSFDSTMTRYALRSQDGTIQVRRVEDDEEIARFRDGGDREAWVFGLSPDGRYLAATHDPDHGLTVWEIERRAIVLSLVGPSVRWGRFSPNSRLIAIEREGKNLAYDLATGQPLRTWRGPETGSRPIFRPDGAEIAVTQSDKKGGICRILDAKTGRPLRSIQLPTFVSLTAWSPDGSSLVFEGSDRRLYLWDPDTGIRRSTLEGHVNAGLIATFHPAGTLLASNGWEDRLWLWEPVLGRSWLNVTGRSRSEFSPDGRIILEREGEMMTYQIDPALEYRTLAHVSSRQMEYGHASIRQDGRVLAVGTNRGVVFWDLARGAELGFLPIGQWCSKLASSGDLITSGSMGVQRWHVQLEPDRRAFRIGQPQPLPLPAGIVGMDVDPSGRVIALAHHGQAFVSTPKRVIIVGPLDDCRYVAASPDGEWLATGSHVKNGAQVWRLHDETQVAQLAVDGIAGVAFSPDGKWLMTKCAPCRLWTVGTWTEARQVGGSGLCFSPDSRLVVVQDANKLLRLVGTESGRTFARLESPDLCPVGQENAAFSPDGSRLVINTPDGPAVHVWDLRAIRRHLARMGLDWDAPAYSDDDLASPTLPPLPKLKIDYGPNPLTGYSDPKVFEPLIAELETSLARYPSNRQLRGMVAQFCNNYAWGLATTSGSPRDPGRALSLARRAVELASGRSDYLNTLGVAQYRAGQLTESIATLEKSLAAGKGEADAFDLFFLAMARFQLGQINRARTDFDRAIQWRRDHPSPPQPGWNEELDAFQAEARALLDGPPTHLPSDVFDR
jgi:serine/threonine protein kinase/WD40 repeat protein